MKSSTAAVLWRMIRYRPDLYAANAVLWTLVWVMPAIPGLIHREFFDSLGGRAGFDVPTLIGFMAGYAVFRILVITVGMINDGHLMFRAGSLLRRNALGRILELPGAAAVDEAAGDTISRFREDVEVTEETMSMTVDMIGGAMASIVAFLVLLSVDARITLLVFPPLVVVIVVAERAGTRIRRYRAAARAATSRVTGLIGEIFGAAQTIKVAGAERAVMDRFRRLNEERRRVMVMDRVLVALLESVFWNTVNIGTGVILLLSARSLGGTLSVGEFALFVYFLQYVTDTVHFVGIFVARYRQVGVSLDRLAELLKGLPARHLAEPTDLHLTGPIEPIRIEPLSPAERLHTLEVRGLSYAHPGTDHGVFDVDLTIPAGSFTVVTGRVGSGKTTLVRALLGLLPADEGVILWNGEPVADPARFFVPPRSAYTPQIPVLFSMSLRDNIRLGLDVDDEAVLTAVSDAVLDPDVATMAEGLDTPVGPLGMRLSGGQVQRTAAARMLVRDPELLVFDDLSSALDVETERTLWRRLFAHHGGATFLVVSHRAAALQRADQILVMESGRVAARGSYEELLASDPDFPGRWTAEEDASGPGEGRPR